MLDQLSQFGSYSEQIVIGYNDLKNEISMLRSQIKLYQENLEEKMEDHHKEVMRNFAFLPQEYKISFKPFTNHK